MGADRKANTWGGGALEAGDPRLVEDGSKRNGAFSSDLIPTKTVSEGGQDEKRRKACQWALTQKRTLGSWRFEAGGLLERLQRRVALEALCNCGSSFGTEPVALETAGWGSEVGG